MSDIEVKKVAQLERIADQLERLADQLEGLGAIGLPAEGNAAQAAKSEAEGIVGELLGSEETDGEVKFPQQTQAWDDSCTAYDNFKKLYEEQLEGVADMAKKEEECQEFNKEFQQTFAEVQDTVAALQMKYNETRKLPKAQLTKIRKTCTDGGKKLKAITADCVAKFKELTGEAKADEKVTSAKERVEGFQEKNAEILKELASHMEKTTTEANGLVKERLTGDAAAEAQKVIDNAVSGSKKMSNLIVKQAEGELLDEKKVATIKGYWDEVLKTAEKAVHEAEEKALDDEASELVKSDTPTKEDVVAAAQSFAKENGKDAMQAKLKDCFTTMPGSIGAITKLGDLDEVAGAERAKAYQYLLDQLTGVVEEEGDDLLG